MKFTDLEFKPHCVFPEEGIHALQFFSNGYGVSVVRFPGSYGFEDDLYEIAVVQGDAKHWQICYNTTVTDDVLGHRDERDVEIIMKEVSAL
jgi:hypothetical protein